MLDKINKLSNEYSIKGDLLHLFLENKNLDDSDADLATILSYIKWKQSEYNNKSKMLSVYGNWSLGSGTSYCPLCNVFFDNECYGCPLVLKGGNGCADGQKHPYDEALIGSKESLLKLLESKVKKIEFDKGLLKRVETSLKKISKKKR